MDIKEEFVAEIAKQVRREIDRKILHEMYLEGNALAAFNRIGDVWSWFINTDDHGALSGISIISFEVFMHF